MMSINDKTLKLVFQTPVISSAVISDCGKYRYSLTRIWDNTKPKVMFIMLNPSTADEDKDDPTIRRCIGFAKSWGFGGLYVCNLFAYRATNPKELLKEINPIGNQNVWHTRLLAEKVDKVICAWGNRSIIDKLITPKTELALLDYCLHKLYYIELSINNTPKHPLYLKSDSTPTKLVKNKKII